MKKCSIVCLALAHAYGAHIESPEQLYHAVNALRSFQVSGASDVSSLAFNSRGDTLAVGFNDGKVKLLGIKERRVIKKFNEHVWRGIYTLAFDQDDENLITASQHYITRWKLKELESRERMSNIFWRGYGRMQRQQPSPHGIAGSSIIAHHHLLRLAVASVKEVTIIDLNTGRHFSMREPEGLIALSSTSKNGCSLANVVTRINRDSGVRENDLICYALNIQGALATIMPLRGSVAEHLAWDASGRTIAVVMNNVSDERVLYLYRPASAQLLAASNLHEPIDALALHNNGTVAYGRGCTVFVSDFFTVNTLLACFHHQNGVWSIKPGASLMHRALIQLIAQYKKPGDSAADALATLQERHPRLAHIVGPMRAGLA